MNFLRRGWEILPVIARAIIVGELVATVGAIPPELLLVANLRFSPKVPWLLPFTAAWLWFFWRFLNGSTPPRQSAAVRESLMRAPAARTGVWPAALVAGGFALSACLAFGFLTATLVGTPPAEFQLGINFSQYPWWTTLSALLAISVTAGIAEEAGFRGYMLTMIEKRHGWVVGAVVTGYMFYWDHHLSHAYATFAYLPFFMAIGAVHVALVKLTGSIKPSVVLHCVFDLAVTPVLYGVISAMPTSVSSDTATARNATVDISAIVVLGIVASLAFQWLRRESVTTITKAG